VGLGGAIPGNLAREVAEQLIKHGEMKRSWLGMGVQPLLKASGRQKGVLVSSVIAGSPAAKSGLKAGDILLSFEGRPLTIHHLEEIPAFHRLVLGTPIGSKVTLTYERDGKEHQASAVTLARGTAQGKETEIKSWGVTVRELSLLEAQRLKREAYSGLLVTGTRVASASADAKPALRFGDILVKVGDKDVHTIKELVDQTAALVSTKETLTPILVGFDRGTQHLLTVVKLGHKQSADTSREALKAWLPVSTQVLTSDLAEALGLKGKKGVRITRVFDKSTASKAGLKVGDVLLRLDGDPIDVSRPEEEENFALMIRQHKVGAKVRLEGVREGKPMMVEVELERSPPSPRQLPEYHDTLFDFRARSLTFLDKVQQQLPEKQQGVLITDVEQGGWAALARLSTNDVLLKVDDHAIHNLKDLRDQMERVAKERRERVVFFVQRGVQTLFIELEPDWTAK
jgi:serine protease Do